MAKTTTEKNSPNADRSVPAISGGRPIRETGPPEWPISNPAIHAAVEQCLADGTWGQYHGPYHEQLVERLAAYHDCEHSIPCASGTVAVELSLRGLRVGPGDEVVMAAYDFKGNFQNVLTVGAVPVLVDLEPNNWNIAVDQLTEAIGEKTKAIVVSHLHGGVVNMPHVMEIARQFEIPVIEDACQMPGANIHGKVAGMWGDVGVLSFGGSKLLSAGRGGAVLTKRDDVAQRIRLYTHRGNEAYPLSELQACVLLPQLESLDQQNGTRLESVGLLCKRLAKYPGLVPFQNDPDDSSIPGYYKLGLQYNPECFEGLSRELFSEAIRAEGIAISPGFRALHRTHGRRRFRKLGDLTVADDADARILTLHHPVLLNGVAGVDEIITAVKKIYRHATSICEQHGRESASR